MYWSKVVAQNPENELENQSWVLVILEVLLGPQRLRISAPGVCRPLIECEKKKNLWLSIFQQNWKWSLYAFKKYSEAGEIPSELSSIMSGRLAVGLSMGSKSADCQIFGDWTLGSTDSEGLLSFQM